MNVTGRIYEITKISFYNMEIDAVQTDLTNVDVPEDELWDFSFFEDYKIKLINNGGLAEIVDFKKWKRRKEQ